MHAFLSLIWDESDAKADRAAQHLWRIVLKDSPEQSPSLKMPGCILVDYGTQGDRQPMLALQKRDGAIQGAILGHLFERSDGEGPCPRITNVAPAMCSKITDSDGEVLIRSFWGSYIAIIKTGRRWSVITDPTSSIPCFYMDHAGVTIVFSHLEKCPFVQHLGLSINYEFIAALLIYDKISNGETGLNEVRELCGGSRLERTEHGLHVSLLWDPREIASQWFDPPPEAAATLLRQVTQSTVLSQAGAFDNLTVNLSGGLDSSIVLSCLAENGYAGHLSAVHHIVESGDPSELHYARIAAAATGCSLTEMHFPPGKHLPDIESHPLSVRPWRQFLSTMPLNGYVMPKNGSRRAVFTGQGGDHLFHVAQTTHGFTDYICHHGPAAGALKELMYASRLSGHSIWSVGRNALGEILPHPHDSEMVRTLRNNRNPLNEALHARISPEDCLPVWAVRRRGLPPGKFDQVSALQHMFMIRETIDRPVLRDFVHPLISQPLIELCLRLPVYRLCHGGISRGLAREAFRGRIPDLIRTRMTKGETTRFVIAGIKADLPAISNALMQGLLVAKGLIPPEAIEDVTSSDHLQTARLVRRLRMAYTIEAWLRSWQSALNTQGTPY